MGSEAETRRQFVNKALQAAGWEPIIDYSDRKKYETGAVSHKVIDR